MKPQIIAACLQSDKRVATLGLSGRDRRVGLLAACLENAADLAGRRRGRTSVGDEPPRVSDRGISGERSVGDEAWIALHGVRKLSRFIFELAQGDVAEIGAGDPVIAQA